MAEVANVKDSPVQRRPRKWMAAKASALARQRRALGKAAEQNVLSLRSSDVLVKEKVIEAQRPSGSLWVRWRASRGHFWNDTERALFFRQLAAFYAAGIPLERALLHLAGSAPREPLHRRLKEISLQLQRGQPFVSAAQSSGLFTVLQLGVMRAGEQAGELERALNWLAQSEEAFTAYRGRLNARLAYPGLVITCVWLAAPVFLAGLAGLMRVVAENATLPSAGITRWLLHPFLPWLVFLMPPLLLGLAGWSLSRGRVKLASLPFGLGRLVVDQQSIWLGRVLSQLLSAGLTLTQSLTLASQIGGPHRLADTLQAVESGRPLHESLPASLPPLMNTMVAVGEESGNIPELLGRACDILEWNWESRVEGWLAIVEPLLLAALGLVAGLTVLAFSGPLTQLVQSLG